MLAGVSEFTHSDQDTPSPGFGIYNPATRHTKALIVSGTFPATVLSSNNPGPTVPAGFKPVGLDVENNRTGLVVMDTKTGVLEDLLSKGNKTTVKTGPKSHMDGHSGG